MTDRVFRWLMPALLLGAACSNPPAGRQAAGSIPDSTVLRQGKEAASAVFAALSGRLQQSLQAEGAAGAIRYCNLAALPLTDSIAAQYGCAVRRTSLRVRNPLNAPDSSERAQLERYALQLRDSLPLAPAVARLPGGEVRWYGPIFTADLCLKCHGQPGSTLLPEVPPLLSELYPEDRAAGYQAGEWRGMWSIAFSRQP
ncbi:MAG: DUF3365 domain-containing protein [Bacteroidia bacterium]|nr:DUF3365 domain-containing protein [Bacteroidia bacterium]